jgi:HTH-type transcriptional regulator/antitoxin HigA
MKTMTIPVVDSKEGHATALSRIRDLWMADDGTDGAAERDALVVLVRDFEQRTDPWPKLPPVEIVKGVMDSHRLRAVDLVPVFGSKGQVSDFLNGRRRITVTQALRMRKAYHVPLELLLVEEADAGD